MLGSWSYQSYLTPYDSFVFYNAIGRHEDYFYTPVAVAKQLVNGTNYKFVCIAEPTGDDRLPHFAVVSIYQPIHGEPYATDIKAI